MAVCFQGASARISHHSPLTLGQAEAAIRPASATFQLLGSGCDWCLQTSAPSSAEREKDLCLADARRVSAALPIT